MTARLYKIGLTGGIGSGKSRVADLLEDWGATVIDTDAIAHELTAAGGAAMPAIEQAFGPTVIAQDGSLDRAAMRQHAFTDPKARKQLEGILHPMIAEVTKRRASEASGYYLVFVVPLLIESGRWKARVDRVCVVDADPATQIARVQARSGLTVEGIERIMAVQASRQERLAQADDVICNDGNTTLAELEQRTRQLHQKWCQEALK